MASASEDRYFWTPESSLKLGEWLKKTRPSIITDDMTAWISVAGCQPRTKDSGKEGPPGGVLDKAAKIMVDLTQKMKEIDNDDSIPVRASKGKKSKKAVREEAHENAKSKLEELSKTSGYTSGKWMLFPSHHLVDGTWATLARSVATGPLKAAGVLSAKVAASPNAVSEGEEPTHLLCLSIPDVYDLKTIRAVLEVLLREHGLEPSAAKSDLYTLAGIDSSHPCKLRSTIWRPAEVIEGGADAVKALRAQYQRPKREPGEKKELRADGIIESDSEDEKISNMAKAQPHKTAKPPQEKRSLVEHDEDDTEPRGEADDPDKRGRKSEQPRVKHSKRQKTAAEKYRENDIFGGWSDSD